ncbi:hypothetical protein TCAL_07624 [Tigriopus californicus]|uniref:Uncharacterized protein n=2 Tax=Tigriopus californicus TaxID=6832 RepID=A0A553NTZ5_TIGCA|nr:hypothetical protein TCAL_07624 [Tigriopus californicus]
MPLPRPRGRTGPLPSLPSSGGLGSPLFSARRNHGTRTPVPLLDSESEDTERQYKPSSSSSRPRSQTSLLTSGLQSSGLGTSFYGSDISASGLSSRNNWRGNGGASNYSSNNSHNNPHMLGGGHHLHPQQQQHHHHLQQHQQRRDIPLNMYSRHY